MTSSHTLTSDAAVDVKLTETQEKILRSKYLHESQSIPDWLHGVAHNIALAELLYHPKSPQWGLFDGVRVVRREMLNPWNPRAFIQSSKKSILTRSWYFHSGIFSAEDREFNFQRFVNNCERAFEKYDDAHDLVVMWERRFFEAMQSWIFLPNSPTLMNAGRDIQQLSACYVCPVDDSMEGITHALQAQALIHKSGGGTGFSFAQLRPKGDRVKSNQGVASGVVSFMQVFDLLTDVIKQGGSRRGANMGVLPTWHPEIKDFIRMKGRPGFMENFNVSVAATDNFMEAIEENKDIDLLHPRTKDVVGQASAREIFDLIVECAWRSGDPGLIFIDRINDSTSNPTPALGAIEATNPCGEQPLLPNESCNLGSINLAQFVNTEGPKPIVDWIRLLETVTLAVRFLDNVIDMNNYPLPEIELMSKGNRRIGLGVMGWAEMLVKMNIAYDSDEGLALARDVMEFINKEALNASVELAEMRGVFINWKNSVYDPSSVNFKGDERYPRHCARTTIAPTGTISLAAGLQGSGIEPFYAIAYTRYNARALQAMKNGQTPDASDTYVEINPLFKQVAQKNNFFGLSETDLWAKIEANKKSVRGLSEIPADVQRVFATAHDVRVDYHVKMQASFQEHTDNGVSKTINLPETATPSDVREAFLLSYKMKCKGITIYRDGSKQQQVLNLIAKESERYFENQTVNPINTPTESAGLELWNLAHSNKQCPECLSEHISFNAGCSGPTCHDCGHSECV